MTPEDKQKVVDAYRANLELDPRADEKDKVLSDFFNRPLTRRQSLEESFTTDHLFDVIEDLIKHQGITLDQYLENVRNPTCPLVRQKQRTHKLRIPGFRR